MRGLSGAIVNILYLDKGSDYTDVCICQNSVKDPLNISILYFTQVLPQTQK